MGVPTSLCAKVVVLTGLLVAAGAPLELTTDIRSAGMAMKISSAGNIILGVEQYGTLVSLGLAASSWEDFAIASISPLEAVAWAVKEDTGAVDVLYDIVLDVSDNVYAVGTTSGQWAGQTSQGGYDCTIGKHNSAGVRQWYRQFGTAGTDVCHAGALDSAGANIYVTGYTAGALAGETHQGQNDVIIAKMTSAGVLVFAKQYGSTGSDVGYDIALDPAGSVYVAGTAQGAINICGSCTFAGYHDSVLTKFDTSGNPQWTRMEGGWPTDEGRAVETDSSGSIYLSANVGLLYSGAVNFNGIVDIAVAKYDTNGNEVWVQMHGTPGYDHGNRMQIVGTELFIFGYTGGAFLGAKQDLGGLDALVIKLSTADGTLLATDQFGSKDEDKCADGAVAADGTVYLTGRYYPVAQEHARIGFLAQRTVGSTCGAGSFHDMTSFLSFDQCKQCPAQTYSTAAASSACASCPLGSISSPDFQSCNTCVSGTFATNTTCVPCAQGSFSEAGSIICVPCSKGFYAPVNATQCAACPIGTYSDEPGQRSCKPCEYSSSTKDTASSDKSLCICQESEYGDPQGESPRNCTACPIGGNVQCNGGLWPLARKGFFNTKSIQNGETAVSCVPPGACPGGYSTCSDGFEGYACRVCMSGYFRKAGTCALCPTSDWNVLGIIIAFVVILVAGAVLLSVFWLLAQWIPKVKRYSKHLMNARPAVMRMLSLQVGFFQLAFTILTLGLPFSFPGMDVAINSLDIFSFDISQFTNTSCASGVTTPYYIKYYLKLLSPLLLLVIILVGSQVTPILGRGISALKRGIKGHDSTTVVMETTPIATMLVDSAFSSIGSFLVIINMLYYVIHTIATEPLQCFKVDGEANSWVLGSDPSISCYSNDTDWLLSVPASILALIIYSLGIPLLFATAIVCHFSARRRRSSLLSLYVFNFLWEKYDDHLYFWELIIVGKKFTMGFGLILGFGGPTDQALILFIISFVAFFLHSFYKPFTSQYEDFIELSALLVILLLISTSLVGDPTVSRVSYEMQIFLQVFITTIILLQLVVMVILLSLVIRNSIKNESAVIGAKEEKKRIKAAIMNRWNVLQRHQGTSGGAAQEPRIEWPEDSQENGGNDIAFDSPRENQASTFEDGMPFDVLKMPKGSTKTLADIQKMIAKTNDYKARERALYGEMKRELDNLWTNILRRKRPSELY